MRLSRNIAGGLVSEHDLTTSVIGGLAEPVLSGIGDAVMRRILPQPRPLLDLEAPRTPPNNPWRRSPNPLNIAQLPPSIVLQPHQPNVGATQQPLPPAVSNQHYQHRYQTFNKVGHHHHHHRQETFNFHKVLQDNLKVLQDNQKKKQQERNHEQD